MNVFRFTGIIAVLLTFGLMVGCASSESNVRTRRRVLPKPKPTPAATEKPTTQVPRISIPRPKKEPGTDRRKVTSVVGSVVKNHDPSELAAKIRNERIAKALELLNEEKPEEALEALGDREEILEDETFTLLAAQIMNQLGDPAAATEFLEYVKGQWTGNQPLKMGRLLAAQRVNGLRDYEEFRLGYKFSPGDALLLYIEAENFATEKVGYGKHKVTLQFDLQLIDQAGRRIQAGWDEYDREFDRVLQGEVETLALPIKVALPATLVSGRYRIRVAITDRLGQQTDGPVEDGGTPGRYVEEEIFVQVQ